MFYYREEDDDTTTNDQPPSSPHHQTRSDDGSGRVRGHRDRQVCEYFDFRRRNAPTLNVQGF